MQRTKIEDGGKGLSLLKKNRKLSKAIFSILFYTGCLWALLLLLSASPKHDYHVSVTQMKYNPAAKIFEVSIKVFTDDLEKALGMANDKVFSVRNNDHNDTYVSNYLQKNFMLMADGKINAFKYIGKEEEQDATWIYIEVPFSPTTVASKLRNSIFSEVFDDQVNMTNIKIGSEKKTILFKKNQLIHSL